MGMKKSDIFKLIFNTSLAFLPGAVGIAAKHVEDAVQADAPADEKKSVAVAKVIGSESVAALSALAKTDLANNPKFVAIVGKMNDAIYQAAKEAAELVDAADGTAGA